MKSLVLKYSKKNEPAIIRTAVRILKRGGLIVYPTDTIYGIGCDVSNKKAVSKIYRIKKRPRSKPLSILVSSINMASKYVQISKKAKKMLPGKYTFILKRKRWLPVIPMSEANVGVRITNHWSRKIPRAFGKPITTTSANIHCKGNPTSIKNIIKAFGSSISLYIDAGQLKHPASKIYNLKGKRIR